MTNSKNTDSIKNPILENYCEEFYFHDIYPINPIINEQNMNYKAKTKNRLARYFCCFS